LNMGDSYASNWGAGANRKSSWWSTASGELEGKGWGDVETAIPPNMWRKHPTIKPKDLIGIPWRVVFALQADGWYLRSDIIWHKPNPMPESVKDRPTKSHEYVFLLAKSSKYFYDADAVREPAKDWGSRDRTKFRGGTADPLLKHHGLTKGDFASRGRNKRSVWTIPTASFKGAHFAVFPKKLVEPMVKAGCPKTGIVLDPFVGSGTTCVVAKLLGRDYVGIDVSEKYCKMAEERIVVETTSLCVLRYTLWSKIKLFLKYLVWLFH